MHDQLFTSSTAFWSTPQGSGDPILSIYEGPRKSHTISTYAPVTAPSLCNTPLLSDTGKVCEQLLDRDKHAYDQQAGGGGHK